MLRFILALTAAAMLPHQVAAQATVQAEQAHDAHADLYAAIQEGVDETAALDSLVEIFTDTIKGATPELALLEAESPGLSHALGQAMRPILAGYSARVKREYAPRMVQALRSSMTVEEAARIAAFYRSEIGLTVLRQVSSQADQRDTIADGLAQREITADSVQRDTNRTVGRAMLAMSGDERQRLFEAVAAVPELARMDDFMQRSLALQTEMQNAPLTPAEEKGLETALNDVFAARFPEKARGAP